MNLNLKDKVVFITGGSHGIGRAIAIELAKEGCKIAFTGRDCNHIKEVSDHLRYLIGDNYLALPADAFMEHDLEESIYETGKKFGGIDILINNIGGGGRWGTENPLDTDILVWKQVYDKNVNVAIECTMEVIPYMLLRNWGRVIAIASIYGYEGGGRPWFSMAKAAEISLMKSLSLMHEFASHNITFNSIAPGIVMIPDTGWDKIKREHPEEYEKVINNIPTKKPIMPEEIASTVAFLCSDNASSINGQCIRIDGGQTRSY